MVAFSMGASRPPSSSLASTDLASHSVRTITGSLHAETSTPNQDTYATHTASEPHVYLVLDGHGPQGDLIATHAAAALLGSTLDRLTKHSPGPPGSRRCAALRAAFAATAELVDTQSSAADGGTTASVVVLERNIVTVANVGDSDVVLSNRGNAEVISVCHRPSSEVESARVLGAGGLVQNGYVCDADPPNKMISITRAFGDLDVRSVGVVSLPEMKEIILHEGDFLILATDGLWDAHGGLSPQSAVDAVSTCFEQGGDVKDAVDALVAKAKGRCSLPIDDLTILVIHPKSEERRKDTQSLSSPS